MAMGIFEQLAWLTTKVKRLCCAVEEVKTEIQIGALQQFNIDTVPYEGTPGYNITEGGIYQFYGGLVGGGILVNYAYPTSAGQVMYIINAGGNTLVTTGLSPADRPFGGAFPTNVIYDPMPDIQPNEIYQLISVECPPTVGPGTGLIWIGIKMYPNGL